MYYRRKIILSLIELLNGKAEKLRLQKLLFLYTTKKQNPEYYFVPFKRGCYSFSAKADLNIMLKRDLIKKKDNHYLIYNAKNYFKLLNNQDQVILQNVVQKYGRMKLNKLIKYTYTNFPFFAIYSDIARDRVPKRVYKKIEQEKPKEKEMTLFTIGYEGKSLEGYLQKLIKKNIKLLIDVRKIPRSRKFGFSKKSLKHYTENTGIDYVHFPEVGITSNKRKNLKTKKDYEILFNDYCSTVLNNTIETQKNILKLLRSYNRIALTCFEAEPLKCHRTYLAHSISKLSTFQHPIIHL